MSRVLPSRAARARANEATAAEAQASTKKGAASGDLAPPEYVPEPKFACEWKLRDTRFSATRTQVQGVWARPRVRKIERVWSVA
jgi:hypothetical protein